MFGVKFAAHAASRSAKTSPGAARNNAIVCPSSVSSTLRRRIPRIPNPHYFFTPNYLKHPDKLGLDCVKIRAKQEPELGSFWPAGSLVPTCQLYPLVYCGRPAMLPSSARHTTREAPEKGSKAATRCRKRAAQIRRQLAGEA